MKWRQGRSADKGLSTAVIYRHGTRAGTGPDTRPQDGEYDREYGAITAVVLTQIPISKRSPIVDDIQHSDRTIHTRKGLCCGSSPNH